MKHIILALAVASLSSCASMAPYSYREQCAFQGMTLDGVSAGSSSAFAVGPNGNWASASGNSSGFHCVLPRTDEDKCEINQNLASAAPKAEYNDGYKTKYFLSGLGYWLFILPGVALKIVYDNQLNEAQAKSDSAYRSADCRQPASAK